MKLRARVAGILAAALAFAAVTAPVAAAQAPAFTDVGALTWAQPSIDAISLLGVMGGTGQGQFDPSGTTTRAQLAVVMGRLLQWPTATPAGSRVLQGTGFRDWGTVPSWARSAMAIAVERGILVGEPEDLLWPNAPVTWAQLAVIAARTFGYPQVAAAQVAADLALLPAGAATPSWGREAVAQDVEAGDFTGLLTPLYQPDEPVTRAALAVFLVDLARGAGNPNFLAGQISSVGASSLTLGATSGASTVPLAPGAAVYSGTAQAGLGAVQVGDTVSLVLKDGQAVWLDITSVPAGITLSGTVASVAAHQVQLTLPGNVPVTLPLAASVDAGALSVGAAVTLELNGSGQVVSIGGTGQGAPSSGSQGASASGSQGASASGSQGASASGSQGASSPSQPPATSQVAQLSFSPAPIASNGSLSPGATVTVTLSGTDANGAAASGAVVELSFNAGATGGSASAGGTSLTATPQPFALDPAGRIQITYTAPAAASAAGSDAIVATSSSGSATVAATDTYVYQAPASQTATPAAQGAISSLRFSPSPVAGPGSLSPGQSVTVTLQADGASGQPAPASIVYLSFHQGSGGGSVWVGGTALSSAPQPFLTNNSGQVVMTYTVPASPPSSAADTIVAANAASGAGVTASDTYSFGAAATGGVAPNGTFTATVQSVGGSGLVLLLPDGSTATLVLAPGVTVTRGGQAVDLAAVTTGEQVTVSLNSQEWITSIVINSASNAGLGTKAGYLTSYDAGANMIGVYGSGGLNTYWLNQGLQVVLNGQPASIGQIPIGDSVSLTLNGSAFVTVLTAVAPPNVTSGTVLSATTTILTLQTGSTTQTVGLSPYTVAVRGGSLVPVTSLPSGTAVLVVPNAATYGGSLVIATS